MDKELQDQMVEAKRVNDHILTIKLVVGGILMNVVSAYVVTYHKSIWRKRLRKKLG